MITSLHDWLAYLRDSHSAMGFPLIVCGIGLMLFGWRLWKVAVVLSFGVFGTVMTARLLGPRDDQMLYALGSGTALGLLSYWPVRYSVSVLGGAIGAAVVQFYLDRFGMTGGMMWGGVAAAFAGCTALAVLNRRHIVILVTAFLGAVLVLSGLMTWLMTVPSLFGTFKSMASWSVIVIPFIVLVPTVMSCFYQISEVHRLQAEL